jgi:hypothetical protein
MIFGAMGAQQYVGLRQLIYESYCGRFAGISRAQLCFVVRIATDTTWQAVDFPSIFIQLSSS